MTELWAGEFGRYQWIQYLLHLLPAFTGGVHMLSQVEVGATPRHRCLAVNDTILEYVGSCHYVSVRNETLPCKAWEYDRTYYESTIVTDWDLVCDRRWMASVSQSAYMLGALIASSLLGQLSDRLGRWKVLVPTGALQMVLATGCGFVQNYYLYVALRFLIAVNVSGAYMIGFVLTMEMAPDRYRTMIGFSFQLVFALGITVVAGWAYLVRHWPILQIIFGLHSSLMLLHWWFVDESPRWLFSQGRYQECDAIIRKMLIQNGKADAIPEQGFTIDQLQRALSTTTSDIGRQEPLEQATTNVTPVVVQEGGKEVTTVAVISSSDRKYGIVDLFKTPRLRSRTLNISLNWFANSLVYYGLTLNSGSLVGDPHLMLFISGIIEVPAYLLSAKIIDILGRRPVISFCLVSGGLACICTTYFPQSSFAWTTATTSVVMLGKSLISISFAIIYNYTAELFPTVVRSSAVGIGSTSARVSGTLTPLIFLLDSLDPKLPSVLFGIVALAAGFFSLYLPETRDSPLLHTLTEGEEFGVGDTGFARLCGGNKSSPDNERVFETAASTANIIQLESQKE
ncbi:organic cation transporter protein-like [Daphnia pulicaria]|uniref:organic cation transporter protein-like n=1 Tax=Daphnia pulicaria TaxID=35523 RepID=UPI001EEB7CC5|nr:organic cation transporter protein-like [Daphnia pulicaria]XP_046654330.1 organic cation transporter protein-like [Daphnia pulicaria]